MFWFISRHAIFLTAMFIALATFVSGCEGDCPVGITNALIGNYSVPLKSVLSQIADSITSRCLGGLNSSTTYDLLAPVLDEYHKQAFDSMEKAIFKTYFHGRCQNPTTGIDPPGCPNPDCPVVCGTPGSIVHFYNVFQFKAFNSTAHVMESITSPNSAAFKQVEEKIEEAAGSTNRRTVSRFIRSPSPTCANGESVRATLVGLFRQFRRLMIVACGGTPEGRLNGLPGCHWEQEFKTYILSFP